MFILGLGTGMYLSGNITALGVVFGLYAFLFLFNKLF